MKSKTIWIIPGIVVGLLTTVFVPSLFAQTPAALPDALRVELIHATSFEALALNHEPANELKAEGVKIGTNQLMGYVILGGVQVTNLNLRLKLVKALGNDIDFSKGSGTDCMFAPRHGIRCSDGKNSVEMAICYHCGDVIVAWNGTTNYCSVKTVRQSPASWKIFEQIFHDAGVKEDNSD